MTEENTFEFQIHYYLNEESLHQMDAKVHNECERQLLNAFDIVKAYTGEFSIEVACKEEGGLIDTLILKGVALGGNVAGKIFDAIIQKFFTSEQIRLVNIQSRLDIIKKIKTDDLSEEEALLLVDNDPKLTKIVSNYFKSLEKAEEVISVSASVKRYKNENFYTCANIVRADFTKKILLDTTVEDKTEIAGTTIRIFSPILQQGHGKIWRGYYLGKPIDFKVLDKEFLTQVYSNEIKFGANTVITCTLIISIKHKIEKGEESEPKKEYAVKDVIQWADDDAFHNHTKRYKKIKANERQLDLFNSTMKMENDAL
ncbi:MAG: hypothetical protein SPI30_01555 [Prevotella sp.]|nr:hypothetical protein [Prevotella sp.]